MRVFVASIADADNRRHHQDSSPGERFFLAVVRQGVVSEWLGRRVDFSYMCSEVRCRWPVHRSGLEVWSGIVLICIGAVGDRLLARRGDAVDEITRSWSRCWVLAIYMGEPAEPAGWANDVLVF